MAYGEGYDDKFGDYKKYDTDKYKIYFIRGCIKEVDAKSPEEAWERCILLYPETAHLDLLKTEKVED